MTDYKLMPVEPSADMLGNAMSVCTGFSGDYGTYNCYLSEDAAREVYQAFRAVAPAVQGEPVAYAVFADNGNIRIWCADPIQAETLRQQYGETLQPLYTAPQPAPDVAGLVEALKWLRGAINCTPENDKHQSGAWISTSHPRIKRIDALIAAYRKQGGEA